MRLNSGLCSHLNMSLKMWRNFLSRFFICVCHKLKSIAYNKSTMRESISRMSEMNERKALSCSIHSFECMWSVFNIQQWREIKPMSDGGNKIMLNAVSPVQSELSFALLRHVFLFRLIIVLKRLEYKCQRKCLNSMIFVLLCKLLLKIHILIYTCQFPIIFWFRIWEAVLAMWTA